MGYNCIQWESREARAGDPGLSAISVLTCPQYCPLVSDPLTGAQLFIPLLISKTGNGTPISPKGREARRLRQHLALILAQAL